MGLIITPIYITQICKVNFYYDFAKQSHDPCQLYYIKTKYNKHKNNLCCFQPKFNYLVCKKNNAKKI